jgi:hypothetical protein
VINKIQIEKIVVFLPHILRFRFSPSKNSVGKDSCTTCQNQCNVAIYQLGIEQAANRSRPRKYSAAFTTGVRQVVIKKQAKILYPHAGVRTISILHIAVGSSLYQRTYAHLE